MDASEVASILRDGIYVLLMVSAPPLLIALFIGLIISLFQALTQIQEATLTFVPKIVALLLTLIFALPFMYDKMVIYTESLYTRIANIE
jgi:flagellar biosynthetic protein FliQ